MPSKYVNRPNSLCKENNQSALDCADCRELLIGAQKAMLLLAKLCRISAIFVKKPNTPILFLRWHVGGENIIVNNLKTAHRISLRLQMLLLPSFTRDLLFFFSVHSRALSNESTLMKFAGDLDSELHSGSRLNWSAHIIL